MKKNILVLALIVLVVLGLGSCTTTQMGDTVLPAAQQIQQGKTYVVLGRVTATFESDNYGYAALYEVAKKTYPDCVDIINVFIDVRSDDTYIMSALAIKY